jgi:hypothetical protein
MRLVSLCCTFLVLCGLAAGQATVIRGTASNWVPTYGVYAAPFVPLVTTPEITLSTVSPWAAGASSSAFGLVAGATNSTLSDEFVGDSPVGPFTQPLWYQPSAQPEYGTTGAIYGPAVVRPEGGAYAMHGRREAQREQAFDFVSQPRESRESVAVLRAEGGQAGKASRTYTNQDVERQNQNNGTVKYDSKTEHI